MNKLKLLITGSCGFTMSNFIRRAIYEKMPYNFVSIDKITKSSILNNIYSNKSHSFYIGDIADKHFVNIIFEYEKPDIILHSAAETISTNSDTIINSNILGTQTLIDASIKYNVKKFIYVSTYAAYGQLENDKDLPWKEDAALNPRNLYTASKAAGELIVKAANASNGINYCITRSSNIYGPRQSAEKLIPKTIKSILEDKKITIYDQGLQMRDFTHVFDDSSALLKILESGENNSIYNISANQEYTNIEVVNEICNVMGKGHNLISFCDRPGHDFRRAADSSKIRELGWEPKFKFKQGIIQNINWFLTNKFFLDI